MNRLITLYIIICCCAILTSCSIPTGLNDNPNELTTTDVSTSLFLNGAQLANSVIQAGHVNRIAGLYSGQLVAYQSLYSGIYNYGITSGHTSSVWNHIYIAVLTNTRHIQRQDDILLSGISKVVEAHALGTGASVFGDVPFSEAGAVSDPKFDSQKSVFAGLITILDAAISDLTSASSRDEPFDIYFEGDASKWVAAAYTLKARYLLQIKDYTGASAAALNGISSPAGDMLHKPRGVASITEGDKNLFWTILEGSRSGDLGTRTGFLMDLLDPANAASRNNAKTDETARFGYYTINESGGNDNDGIIEQYEPHRLVTYSENLLILAECGARTAGFSTGLGHLNTLRAYLNAGGWLNSNYSGLAQKYDAYVDADFAAGGIENADSISQDDALLREIIEERYVSGFGTYMPFNDARRLRKSEGHIAVPFPLNTGTATQHVERLPYGQEEIDSNSNAPADPGILAVTEVNQ